MPFVIFCLAIRKYARVKEMPKRTQTMRFKVQAVQSRPFIEKTRQFGAARLAPYKTN